MRTRLVTDDMGWAALFGGLAAGVSLKLAQRADPLLSAGSQDRLLGSGDPFAAEEGAFGRRGAPAWRSAAE